MPIPKKRKPNPRSNDAPHILTPTRVTEIHGLKLFNVAGDGNCFYRAVAHQLENRYPSIAFQLKQLLPQHNLKLHHLLRAMAIIEIKKNHTKYMPHLTTEQQQNYIIKHSKDRTWADDSTISALGAALNLNLVFVLDPNRQSKEDTFVKPHSPGSLTIFTFQQSHEFTGAGYHFQSLTGDPSKLLTTKLAGGNYLTDKSLSTDLGAVAIAACFSKIEHLETSGAINKHQAWLNSIITTRSSINHSEKNPTADTEITYPMLNKIRRLWADINSLHYFKTIDRETFSTLQKQHLKLPVTSTIKQNQLPDLKNFHDTLQATITSLEKPLELAQAGGAPKHKSVTLFSKQITLKPGSESDSDDTEYNYPSDPDDAPPLSSEPSDSESDSSSSSDSDSSTSSIHP